MWARKVWGSAPACAVMRDQALNYAYVQVAMTIMGSRETEDREYRPFEKLRTTTLSIFSREAIPSRSARELFMQIFPSS